MTRVTSGQVAVVRRHGLGNVLQLLPVLRTLAADGRSVTLTTRAEWTDALSAIAPEVTLSQHAEPGAVDLDRLTLTPTRLNRTAEFMAALGVSAMHKRPVTVPSAWLERWSALAGAVVFSPEASFPARRCPPPLTTAIGADLADRRLVVVGCDSRQPIPCWRDLRGRTSLSDLFAIVRLASAVVCMDSGVLHIAGLLDVPTVALFGGITPESRTRVDQRTIVLAGDVSCRPCDKNETCNGAYWCLARLRSQHVMDALRALETIRERKIIAV